MKRVLQMGFVMFAVLSFALLSACSESNDLPPISGDEDNELEVISDGDMDRDIEQETDTQTESELELEWEEEVESNLTEQSELSESDPPVDYLEDLVITDQPLMGTMEETISVQVESDDLSVLISAFSKSADADVAVWTIENPNGKIIYSMGYNETDIWVLSDYYSYPSAGIGSATIHIPPVPDMPFETGEYLVTFIALDSPLERVKIIKKKDTTATEFLLDWDIWIATDNAPLDTDSARQDYISTVLGHVSDLLRPHNMDIGTITIQLAEPEIIQQFSTLDMEQVELLCQALANQQPTRRAMRLVVVDWVDYENQHCCGGVSPASPGGILDSGVMASCVAASYYAYGRSYAEQGANFLHEGAHFLGLPHTSESDGKQFDAYSDTPECHVEEKDSNGDQQIDDYECGIEGGANNVMFFGGTPDFLPYYLSPQQVESLRIHPLLIPVLNE